MQGYPVPLLVESRIDPAKLPPYLARRLRLRCATVSSLMTDTLPWVEKYRPASLDDVVAPRGIVKTSAFRCKIYCFNY